MTVDQFKHLIGDLARPFAIIVTSACAGVSSVILSLRIDGDGAAFIGAVFLGVAGLYGAKAYEIVHAARNRRATDQQPEG